MQQNVKLNKGRNYVLANYLRNVECKHGQQHD